MQGTGGQLKRVLGLPLLTFYGVGMILGAGIYTIIGKATAIAGESVWMSVLLAAIAAILTALSYAELSTMFPRVGGEYVFLKEAFPRQRWLAGTIGLLMALAGISTASTVALAFAGYLAQFFTVSTLAAAILLLSLLTFINILGIKESSWANVAFTSIEVFGLLLFIYFGVASPRFGESLQATPSFSTASASALLIFAYFGFENIVNFVEETKQPERVLPQAILTSIAIATLLYTMVALAAVSLLPLALLAQSEAPLAEALRPTSERAARILTGIALFATANTVLISLSTTSRIFLAMSRDLAVSKIFGALTKRRRTPWVASFFSFFIAVSLVPLGKVEVLASLSSLATMSAFSLVNIALIVLRFRQPATPRPFRTPLSLRGWPLLPVCGVFICIFLLLQFEASVYQIGGGFLVLILISQWVRRRQWKA